MTSGKKKALRISVFIISVIIVVLFVDYLIEGIFIWNHALRPNYRNKMIQSIKDAKTDGELKRYFQSTEGNFFKIGESDWIGIAYHCSHCYRTDIAIACDSKGRWLQSNYHFCGHLKIPETKFIERRSKSRSLGLNGFIKGLESGAIKSRDYSVISLLALSANIDDAYQVLIKTEKFFPIEVE